MSRSPLNTLDNGSWPPTGALDKPGPRVGDAAQPSGWGKVGSLRPKQAPIAVPAPSESLAPYTLVDTQIADTLLKAGVNRDAPIRASSSTKQRAGLGSIDTFFGAPPASHSSAPATQRKPPPQAQSTSPTRTRNMNQPSAPLPYTSQSKGKGKAVDPQEYQTYTQELEKMFGKQGDMDVSVSRLKDPSDGTTRESFVIGRVKGTPPKAKAKARGAGPSPPPFIVGKKIVQQPRGNVSRNVTHASSSRSKEGQPPKPRQDFEEISRRVIESTPDKTVTISTWREQVAQETTVEEEDGSMERISVYYVSGHAQPEAVANATAELDDLGPRPPPVSVPKEKVVPKEPQELPQLQHTMTSQPLAEIMALSPEQDNSMVYSSPEAHLEDSRLLDEHVEQYMSPKSRVTAASWIRPSQYLASTVVNAIRDHQRPSSSRYFAPSSPSSSLAPRSPGDVQRNVRDEESSFDDDDDDDESESRSPSQFPPTPPPKAAPTLPRLKTGSKLMQSTPVVSAFAMPSFHPTRDGSIISSINSGDHHDLPHPSNIIQSPDHLYPSPRPSMSPKGLRTQVLGGSSSLEGVLNSCRPSLRHLLPTLAHLGITTKDHLHALAELDPETRDKELKEEALRGGVTNMEWAMLMNRLKSL